MQFTREKGFPHEIILQKQKRLFFIHGILLLSNRKKTRRCNAVCMFGAFLPHIKFKQINHKYLFVRVASPKMPPTRSVCNAVVPEQILLKNYYIDIFCITSRVVIIILEPIYNT